MHVCFLTRGDARAYHKLLQGLGYANRSLVLDGHRVDVNPNSRVRRSIISEEEHARRSSV